MKGLLSANVRAHGSRYAATAIAIALATMFILACFGVAGGFQANARNTIVAGVGGSDYVIELSAESSMMADSGPDLRAHYDAVARDIEALPEVRAVAYVYNDIIELKQAKTGHTNFFGLSETKPEPFENTPTVSGRLPDKPGEVAIDEPTAKSLSLKVGDPVEILSEKEIEGTVVGIVESPALSFSTVTVASGQINALREYVTPTTILVAAHNGQETAAAPALEKKLDELDVDRVGVTPTDTYIDSQIDKFSKELSAVLGIILIFPALAAITAIIVISTTFQVLLAQRQRELALLRSIGADAGQVRTLLIKENFLVGTVSSLIGIGIGVVIAGLVNNAAKLTHSFAEGVEAVPMWAYPATVAFGLFITLAAGMRPAIRAARVSPMRALNPNDPESTARKKRLGRLIVGLAVTLGGVGIMAFAMTRPKFGMDPIPFLIAFLGGIITFIGVLILMTWAMPYVTQALGNILGARGLTFKLAGENTWRNPARTGATATALILGLTLVVMMMVGARSIEHSAKTELDERRPIDLTITAIDGEVNADQVNRLKQIRGVEDTLTVRGINVLVDGEPEVIAEATDLSAIARADVAMPGDGQVGVWVGSVGAVDNSINVDVGNQSFRYTFFDSRTPIFTLSATTFEELEAASGAPAQDRVVFLKLQDDLTMSDVNYVVTESQSIIPHAKVSGGATERAGITSLIDGLLIGVLVMLGVSIVVALVGVANTLALSVVERKRENALMRALGLTRGGLRGLLSAEAFVIAVSSIAVGIALGIGFGWFGVQAMPMGEEIGRRLLIPWPEVGLAALVALSAALLASIIPGHLAAKATPVEALAGAE
ncbi:MAG: FtsX-like permease family protein [Actinomycetaceae bacterium]|nr:FtsX-like permease family protein [Actinomycetaceae bacterium]